MKLSPNCSTLVEVEPTSEAEPDSIDSDDDRDIVRGDFVPGGAGHVIELGGMRYDLNAENPMEEVIQLKSTPPAPVTPQTPVNTGIVVCIVCDVTYFWQV